ncbi:OmpA family protein [Emticicia sp. BO119]|uniref:OmpA family protein n=1 Tax=Emticicia sp. BO119 TaxID=2757768 RepID=UPI0015F10FC5|nr:OmpA family protein [Emticicia sp. BO119]MBA4851094.1 OmpA family protein [Emticicia sp. BO119]
MQRNIVSKSLVLAASLLAVGYTNMSCRSTGGMSGRDISTNDNQTTMITPPHDEQAAISTVSLGGTSGEEIKRMMAGYVPALNENLGDIAMVETYDEGLIVTMNKGNIFNVDSYMINEEAKGDLLRVAYSLKQMPNTFVVVNGHTDATGSKEYNENLSKKRAIQVANYLKGAGIEEKRLLVDGYGEKIPKYSNKSYTGRNKNRRVDFIIVADNNIRENVINTGSIR